MFSNLINRYDNFKAQSTVNQANEKLANNNLCTIDNSNIKREHLERKGPHMNPHGTGKFAVNIVRFLKQL